MDHLMQNGSKTTAGFIHLPLESECQTERAVDALSEVIRLVEASLKPLPR